MTARILVVDDTEEPRVTFVASLRKYNHQWDVVSADGPEAALVIIDQEAAKQRPFDVVLIDLVMGTARAAGLDLLREVRGRDPDAAVILFTAQDITVEREVAFKAGAFEMVEKTLLKRHSARELHIKTDAALRFRNLVREVKRLEQEKNDLLARFFDPQVTEMIQHKQANVFSSHALTVCFWDIRGFTRLCEQLRGHPDLVAGFLKDYCHAAHEVIREHGGILDKYIGDGVMALFGYPTRKDAHSDRGAGAALLAADDLGRRFGSVLDDWHRKWRCDVNCNISIGLGCGLNSEWALVGVMGSPARDQFTAVGPGVNLAARIQGVAAAGEVLFPSTTRAMLADQYGVGDAATATPADQIQVIVRGRSFRIVPARSEQMRNVAEPIQLYTIAT